MRSQSGAATTACVCTWCDKGVSCVGAFRVNGTSFKIHWCMHSNDVQLGNKSAQSLLVCSFLFYAFFKRAKNRDFLPLSYYAKSRMIRAHIPFCRVVFPGLHLIQRTHTSRSISLFVFKRHKILSRIRTPSIQRDSFGEERLTSDK